MQDNSITDQGRILCENTLDKVQNEIDCLSEHCLLLNEVNTFISDVSIDKLSAFDRDSIENIQDTIAKIKGRCEKLKSEIKQSYLDVSDNYLQLLSGELMFKNRLTSHFQELKKRLAAAQEESENHESTIISFCAYLPITINNLKTVLDDNIPKITNLEILGHVKNASKNIVMIGANGSGKSTFSRSMQSCKDGNLAIISAQKLLHFTPQQHRTINANSIQSVHAFQTQPKLGEVNLANTLTQDLPQLMLALFEDHANKSESYYNDRKSECPVVAEDATIETVFKIWGDIFPHRKLLLSSHTIQASPVTHDAPYPFSGLSDGEKAAFYYIAHVLLTKPSSYIVIDEPENHLNLSVVNKLWDFLEKKRDDCQFIYLTHNPHFAVSRVNSDKLWNKKYRHPNNWDLTPLPHDESIPEELLIELLGSRSKILFCEGTKSSYDYKLYSILFPRHTVLPVGGHINVVNYTRAYNRNKKIFNEVAVGLIDGDYHLEEERQSWEKTSIFVMGVSEIENILCDEKLLQAAQEQFLSDSDNIDKVSIAKAKLLTELEKTKTKQALRYVNNRINHFLSSSLFEETEDNIEEVENKLMKIVGEVPAKKWYEDRLNLIDEIVKKADYDRALIYCNLKGMPSNITKEISRVYSDKIIPLIRKSNELQQHIRKKYFIGLVEFLDKDKK